MKRSTSQLVFGCAAVLLSYPGNDVDSDLAAVADGLRRLPPIQPRARMEKVQRWLASMAPTAAAACYVDTFDLRRRRSLHLTYFRHGDTRERGMALSAVADVYRGAGFAVAPGELPDFLPAVLELAAVSPAGTSLLREHRPAIDALHDDLASDGSPYADAVAAVTDALGPATRVDRVALRTYRRQGPPSERVGLEPFAPPETFTDGAAR